MASESNSEEAQKQSERNPDKEHFLFGVGRAFAGAIIFALPLFMTAEMWDLGAYVPRSHLLTLLILNIPLLIALSHFLGFETTVNLLDDILDAAIAYGIGFVSAALVMGLMGILGSEMSMNEIVGKIALQAIPGSMGALFARSEFHDAQQEEEKGQQETYWSELFFMLAGALFFSFNLAPTEEILLIVYKMNPWQAVLLMLVSLAVMHAFVYSLKFSGSHPIPENIPEWSLFLRFTCVGYVIALLSSGLLLWAFSRLDGLSLSLTIMAILVLGFPAAVGAAAARLLL